MVAIWEKPEMSDFEKGVVHGMSLAKDAKDREVYEYINRGQFSTPEIPCKAWEKLNLRDKAEIVWHLLKALDK